MISCRGTCSIDEIIIFRRENKNQPWKQGRKMFRLVVITEVLTREQRVSPYFVSAVPVRRVSDDTSQCKVTNKTIHFNRPDDVSRKRVHGMHTYPDNMPGMLTLKKILKIKNAINQLIKKKKCNTRINNTIYILEK